MSLRTATDFKLQKWVLQKRENDKSPFNLFECWVFQFNENESPLLLHGEVSAEVIAKYIYIAIGLLKPWTANFVLLILLKQCTIDLHIICCCFGKAEESVCFCYQHDV
ncbi:hypothetical protein ES288_D13G272900v1 [Gossypium darwinii]|uniref:Uncharacterized protein n=1 Tax=Gossypium darwinii TaxID=34276 RepID=A0A5D2A586_GOSDA|nr:hypothetical protein ES288_D13G272900v1 [Gossypium darwinii]